MSMEQLERFASALRGRKFDTQVFATAAEGAAWIASQIAPGETVGVGGSQSVKDTGLADRIRDAGNTVYWHWYVPGPATLHAANNADVYIASSNAITRDGMLVNIDGTGNRVAAIAYGPGRVYLLCGKNKLVEGGIPQAITRIKHEACVPNARRLNRATPCAQTGVCNAAECPHEQTICNVTLVTDHPGTGGRKITVVLVDEELGF